jgi:DNA-binding MarR family transcriptional regulator
MLVTDWFEARGLVERRHLPSDARAWGLHLTRKGEQLAEKLKRRVLQVDCKNTRSLKKTERRQLLRLLEKLAG